MTRIDTREARHWHIAGIPLAAARRQFKGAFSRRLFLLALCLSLVLTLFWVLQIWIHFLYHSAGWSIEIGSGWLNMYSIGWRQLGEDITGKGPEIAWTKGDVWTPVLYSFSSRWTFDTRSPIKDIGLPLWPFVLAPLGLAIYLYFRRRVRLVPGCCKSCGYDLRSAQSGRCPECGVVVGNLS